MTPIKADNILRCSLLGDRNSLRAALELVGVAERQGCKAIEIWRNNSPSCFYYLTTLQNYQRLRDTQEEFSEFLHSYNAPYHLRGRRCRGKQLDSLLETLTQ